MDPLACTGYSIEAVLELELLEFEVDDQSDDVEENSNQGASTSNSYKLIKESLANWNTMDVGEWFSCILF